MNISGSISAGFSGDELFLLGLQSARNAIVRSASQAFTSGTAAQQCDLMWAKSYTLAAGAATTLVVSALADDLGRAVAFARVKALLVESDATVSGDELIIGLAASNPWTAIVGGAGQSLRVKPYGFLAQAAMGATAFAVAAGSADQLKVANAGANPITFRITLAGCSA